MKIYTRLGDKGTTSLVGGGVRISKADLRLDCYGTLDELNAFLGEAVTRFGQITNAPSLARVESELQKIQNDLFTLGAHLACDSDEQRAKLPKLPTSRVSDLEHEIDWMTAQIPPLKEFILPGGSATSAQLHICRTVTRRAERACVSLSQKAAVDASIIEYLNRLSDYLFTAARFAQQMQGVHDKPWKKP